MPIYEYQAVNSKEACPKCRQGFEIYQQINEKPLSSCLYCFNRVRKIISWCRSAVVEESEEHGRTRKRIKAYEDEGMWSHAAELADKHSEKIKDDNLKMRALENYEKAGYSSETLSKFEKSKNK